MRFNWDDPCFKWGVDALDDNISYGKRNKHITQIMKELFDNKEGEENMTMDAMTARLTKRGFTVTREYNSVRKQYSFEITKNGISVSDTFVYPASCSDPDKDFIQREFINQLVSKWETEKQKDRIRRNYCNQDAKSTKQIRENYHFAIKKVIFNEPATIVLWADGTKTVVKCQEDDIFDPEVGLAMAISKRALGDKGSYCNVFKKWCEPYYKKQEEVEALYPKLTIPEMAKEFEKMKDSLKKFVETRIEAKRTIENAGDA